jgi:hypothetical protein
MRNTTLGRWHHASILWLGAVLFAASLLGCLLTIVLAVRNADPALEVGGDSLLDVPAAHAVREPS